jgi:hypothetical protein
MVEYIHEVKLKTHGMVPEEMVKWQKSTIKPI